MIIDRLDCLGKYTAIRPEIAEIVTRFAATVNAATELKKYSLYDERVFALVQEYTPRGLDTASVEAHHRYIDIHVPVYGEELICYCPVENLELIKDLTPESDDVLYQFDPLTALNMCVHPGYFVWFNPEEGHVPGLRYSSSTTPRNRKIVFKLDATLFDKP